MKCPIKTAEAYKQGFDNGLEFDGFRDNNINWKVGELFGKFAYQNNIK